MPLPPAHSVGPDSLHNGISRSLALGRILHFEALMRRRLGEVRPQRYVRLHNYYSGQNLPPDNIDQPLMINRFKPIVDKHCSYLWGQYKERLIEWRVTYRMKEDLDDEATEEVARYGRQIKRFLDRIYEECNGDQTFWQASKNAGLYGDGVLEVRYDERERRIKIESVLPEYYHCMWNIADMDELTEVIIAYPIDRIAAYEQYGTPGNDEFIGYQAINPNYLPGIGILWKRWSHSSMQVWIDDVNVLNEPNPYMPIDEEGNVYPGIIPFLHIPNQRAGSEFFGYSDGEEVLLLSDELNRRMADAGDLTNMHSHPIVTLRNFSGDVSDLPTGADAIWDLGRDGEANRLDPKGPAPETMAYIDAIKTELHETSAMPETAYGTRKGGTSHNSGLALQMAMMPVVERAREKRIIWRRKFKELIRMIFYLLWIRDPELLTAIGLDYGRVLLYDIEPVFADILPKDTLQAVNENVALSVNALRSTEKALESLGCDDIPDELGRIQQDLLFKAAVGASVPGPGKTGGQNSEQGQGGSADIPGAIGASASKPGSLIKSPETDQLDNVGMSQTP